MYKERKVNKNVYKSNEIMQGRGDTEQLLFFLVILLISIFQLAFSAF